MKPNEIVHGAPLVVEQLDLSHMPMRMYWPTLYRKTAGGAVQGWTISVFTAGPNKPATIHTVYGQVDSPNLQEVNDIVSEGKNAGKKNATTPYEQACKEAEAKWKLQKAKKGYVDTIESAEAGEVDACVEGGYFPMLADKFSTKGDRVEYPAYLQPKLDGYRNPTVVSEGKGTCWSRTRKPVNSMPHIQAQIAELTGRQDAELDGELYNHEWVRQYGKERAFEMLGEYIRTKEPVPGHEQVQYHIYDFPSAGGPFRQRHSMLKKLFELADKSKIPQLVLVETIEVADEDEAILAFERYLDQKYEGAMLRTREGEYLKHPTKRSLGLLKIKKFDDAEFKVLDVKEGRGKMAGKAVFVCDAGNGETFDAKMKGPLEKLKEYWQNPQQYVGKILTVQYQGLTGKKKVPRFPVALRFREEE